MSPQHREPTATPCYDRLGPSPQYRTTTTTRPLRSQAYSHYAETTNMLWETAAGRSALTVWSLSFVSLVVLSCRTRIRQCFYVGFGICPAASQGHLSDCRITTARFPTLPVRGQYARSQSSTKSDPQARPRLAESVGKVVAALGKWQPLATN